VELSIPNRVGPAIQAANVVAELRGSEKPQEFVVLGAHLDSWELGTGALDNGCNAALVIDTLRVLHNAGVKPRRSIRFILFSGEEQGMLGSLAYVRRHRNELDNAVEVLIFDEGTGPAISFSLGGRTDSEATLRPILAPLAQWNASGITNDAFWGTDNFDFLLEGVPTLVANQQEANYLVNYHASSDTFDKVDMQQLKKHVAMASAVVTGIANAPERIAPRQMRSQVEQLLHETKLDEQLKTFGQWTDWTEGRRGRQAER
jgi:Zn-dependent M28 family amino/carboxypeptidase